MGCPNSREIPHTAESIPAITVRISPFFILNCNLVSPLFLAKFFSFIKPALPHNATPTTDITIPVSTTPPPTLVNCSTTFPLIINGTMVPKTAEIPIDIVQVKEQPIFRIAYPKESPPKPQAAPNTNAAQKADEGASAKTAKRFGIVKQPITTGIINQANRPPINTPGRKSFKIDRFSGSCSQ